MEIHIRRRELRDIVGLRQGAPVVNAAPDVRRAAVAVAGFGVLAFGLALIASPVPSLLIIPVVGLVLLARHLSSAG